MTTKYFGRAICMRLFVECIVVLDSTKTPMQLGMVIDMIASTPVITRVTNNDPNPNHGSNGWVHPNFNSSHSQRHLNSLKYLKIFFICIFADIAVLYDLRYDDKFE